ncbi:MAG: hypothetical protein ABI180_07660 [Microcoleus sp.]|jgi:hypothetical protein
MLNLIEAGVGGRANISGHGRKKTVSAKNYLALATKNPWLNLLGRGWYVRDR